MRKKRIKMFIKAAVYTAAMLFTVNVFATENVPQVIVETNDTPSLLSITGESHIYPIEDGSGQYILKSDGFYCLTPEGRIDTAPGVHYFDHADINGTIFHGYYYHGADGKFVAGNPRLVQIQQVICNKIVFDGYYMVGNLGKMSAASQVRYLENVQIGDVCFNGYYYFDINGRMTVEPNIAEIYMTVNGKEFAGNYYFGGVNGVLEETAGVTQEGIPVDENGKVVETGELGMKVLEAKVEELIQEFDGEWSVYVKDLETDESFSINNRSMYSASLIKAFMLAKSMYDSEKVVAAEAALMKEGTDISVVQAKVKDLLWNMITVSDNESFNEIVRLQSDTYDFVDGALSTNEYLIAEGYQDTLVQHTLHPSASAEIGIAENVSNMTSVEDCGLLMERIAEGECVSKEASEQMLTLFKNQECTWKIPEGLPEGVETANKTGETDISQHDIAIVYGDKTTYVLCVMSENCKNADDAVDDIRSISRVVYAYLNY